LIVLTLSFGSPYVLGADVVLREQATTVGPIVRLGDIADISAASSSILKGLATTPLVPTPALGSAQFLQRSQVRDLLATRGIDISSLRFRGAMVVEIGKATRKSEILAQPQPAVFSNREIETSLSDAIVKFLTNETGHDHWRVSLNIRSSAYGKISALGKNISVRGGRRPWIGRQRFQVRGVDSDEEIEVQATVAKIQSVLFARQAIKRGNVIRVVDVEVRQQEGLIPSLAMSAIDQVIGMEAKQSISANTIIRENQVRAPLQVQRGETVTVVARTGGISVRTFAVARQDGAMGDLVQIETLDGSQRFAARVSGRHRLEVLAAGTQAGDYATLGSRSLRR